MKLVTLTVLIACFIAVSVLLVGAQEPVPEGNRVSQSDTKSLDAAEMKLVELAKTDGQTRRGVDFVRAPTHRLSLFYGSAPVPAEQHPKATDIFIVRSGAAALQIGGQIVEPTGSNGELRGPSIKGGETFPARPGSVFNVPPNVAHQWILKTGESVTFMLVKVN